MAIFVSPETDPRFGPQKYINSATFRPLAPTNIRTPSIRNVKGHSKRRKQAEYDCTYQPKDLSLGCITKTVATMCRRAFTYLIVALMYGVSLFYVYGDTLNEWYYPKDPYDPFWEQIYEYSTDSAKADCARLSSIEDLDSLIVRFDTLTRAVTNMNYREMHNLDPKYKFERRIISSLDILSGINMNYPEYANMYYKDKKLEFLDWYHRHRDSLDLSFLKLHITAQDYLHRVIWRNIFNCKVDTTAMLDSVTAKTLELALFFSYNIYTDIEPHDRELIDSLFRVNPDIEAIRKRLHYDKVEIFVYDLCSGLWRDSQPSGHGEGDGE